MKIFVYTYYNGTGDVVFQRYPDRQGDKATSLINAIKAMAVGMGYDFNATTESINGDEVTIITQTPNSMTIEQYSELLDSLRPGMLSLEPNKFIWWMPPKNR